MGRRGTLQTLALLPEAPTLGRPHAPRAGTLDVCARGDTHTPFRQCAADSTKLRAMRVAPQKWPPRSCSEAMKGQACGRAARPPTISEASAGPGGKGGGGAVSRGGTPDPWNPQQDPAGLGSSLACHPERGGGVYGPPAPAQPDLKSPQGAGCTPLHPHHSEPQSPHPMRMGGAAGSRVSGEGEQKTRYRLDPTHPPAAGPAGWGPGQG